MNRSQITFANASTLNDGLRILSRLKSSNVRIDMALEGSNGVLPMKPCLTMSVATNWLSCDRDMTTVGASVYMLIVSSSNESSWSSSGLGVVGSAGGYR